MMEDDFPSRIEQISSVKETPEKIREINFKNEKKCLIGLDGPGHNLLKKKTFV